MGRFGKGKVLFLEERTKSELNINISDYNENSHKRVFVRCVRCGEEFLREFRKLYQLHACPTHKHVYGIDYKWCDSCSKFLPYKDFHANKARYDGFSSFCKECEKLKYTGKNNNRKELKRKSDIEHWIKWSCIRKRTECKKHGIKFTITPEQLIDIWYKQDGRCFYSNIKMTISTNSLTDISFERLNSNIGYVSNNVVFASKAMNNMKNNATYTDFISFLTNMDMYRHTAPRCEYKLIDPKAKLPIRAKSFDGGLDLYSIEETILKSKEPTIIKTGIILSIQDGYYFTVEGRSGMFKNGIWPLHAIIDASYTGELSIVLYNMGNFDYMISSGDRIAQITIHKVYVPDMVMVDDFSLEHKTRGIAGYGSTGR